MKVRLSETQPPSPSSSSSSSSRSPTSPTTRQRQRLYTMNLWLATVAVIAIAPQYCHGYSLSSSPEVSASRKALRQHADIYTSSSRPAASTAAAAAQSSSSIVMSLQDFQMKQQQPSPPIMFLHSRRLATSDVSFSSLTTSNTRTSSTRPAPLSTPQPQIRIASSDPQQQQQPRVLGFDISSTLMSTTALQATRRPRKSNVDVETWNGASVGVVDMDAFNTVVAAAEKDAFSFFPSSAGLLWQNSNSQNKQQQPLEDNNVDENTAPTLLPLWFPWIPTKLQIKELKVMELKEACVQRGLKKTGNKPELQGRLIDWTAQQQQQHQARLTGAASAPATTTTSASTTSSTTSTTSPNSLAEWARTVDLEPLLQRREEIHREKRQPRSFSPQQNRDRHNSHNNNSHNNTLPTPTKEYLTALTKSIRSPSAPNSNNVQVKELYIASKQADQLGERDIAKELLEQLVRLTPNDARLYRRLSRMNSEEGNVSGARAILQQGIRRIPTNGYLWQGLGQLELKEGAEAQARKYLLKAIQVDPSLPHAYHILGTLEHTQGRIADAMKILKQGIQYCPTNHRLHHALGDLYRGAKLLKDAERSYKRALEHSQPVSHCFAFSALAYVAYEKNKIEECRHWLRKSVALNNGRHAQGWVSLAQLEESEDNMDTARSVCIAAITQYERGLIEMKQRHSKQFQQRNPSMTKKLLIPDNRAEQVTSRTNPLEIKNQLLSTVPRYRSGDRFLKLYRNWARLEERHGSFDTVDEVYSRASLAFPYEYKLTLDWASYHASMKNSERARTLFMKACNKAANRHADPYRLCAEYEMYHGNHVQARSILYKGAQANSHSSDGGLGNRRGLAELFHTWAVCEWHLGNVVRAEGLFDHSLRLTEAGEEGAIMRAFILFSIARLEYSRGELTLAQHCIGLCLKENVIPGGNAKVWELWAMIAADMGEAALEEECIVQIGKAQRKEHDNGPTGLSQLLSKGPQMQQLMRRDPWHDKLFGNQLLPNNFYTGVQLPKLENGNSRRSFSFKEDQVQM